MLEVTVENKNEACGYFTIAVIYPTLLTYDSNLNKSWGSYNTDVIVKPG